MTELVDYKFKIEDWPPPKEMRKADTYVFGFDEGNQPYVCKYESQKGYEGWIAATLCDNRSVGASAVPRHYTDEAVGKLIKWWAAAPLLLQSVFRINSENRKKREKEDD